jgi:hypothetical protein
MDYKTKMAAPQMSQFWVETSGILKMALVSFAMAAFALWLAVPDLGGFGYILLFSECVGVGIILVRTLLLCLPWIHKINPLLALILTMVLALPGGYLVGHIFASALVFEPMHISGSGPTKMVPYLATALTGILLLYFLWSREQFSHEASARLVAQQLASESQLRLLRAQIEPHMLFNTLANLRLLVEEDPIQAQLMIDQLIIYLRSALTASRTELIKLCDEFAQLRAYLEIMSLRMGPRLSFELTLPDSLQYAAVPSMLLQPLVENAIKHGAEPKIGHSSIEVVARQTETGIEISVSDTGLGLAPDFDYREPSSSSYGLLHVRERLLKTYGPNASLSITRNAPQGVCSTVKIPQ